MVSQNRTCQEIKGYARFSVVYAKQYSLLTGWIQIKVLTTLPNGTNFRKFPDYIHTSVTILIDAECPEELFFKETYVVLIKLFCPFHVVMSLANVQKVVHFLCISISY